VEHLCSYDRVTLRLWSHGHTQLAAPGPSPHVPSGPRPLAQAAAHAVLTDLRRCTSLAALLARYESTARDLALICSLLPDAPTRDPVDDPVWRARDAAFYLRWQELSGGAGAPGGAGAGDGTPGGRAGTPCP
jgi:hypothetical protein